MRKRRRAGLLLAVIVAVPAAFAVTTPSLLTSATAGSLLRQVTDRSSA